MLICPKDEFQFIFYIKKKKDHFTKKTKTEKEINAHAVCLIE